MVHHHGPYRAPVPITRVPPPPYHVTGSTAEPQPQRSPPVRQAPFGFNKWVMCTARVVLCLRIVINPKFPELEVFSG